MPGRKQPMPSRNLLAALLVICAVGWLLPARWTGGLVSIVQVVLPFQDATTAVADSVQDGLTLRAAESSDGASTRAPLETSALRHQVAALTLRVAELQDEVAVLAATRTWGAQGNRIWSLGRLIPARVVSPDILPWRSSGLVNAGSLRGVKAGDPVASQHFTIDLEDSTPVRPGLAVLQAEALVGFVDEQVGTHAARVKLLSDRTVQMKVRIGRLADEAFTPVEGYFWLTGCGRGRMEIRDVDRRLVGDKIIAMGDVVLSDPANSALPAPMVIGEIAGIERDRENPLLCVLDVKPPVKHDSLRRVYVFDAEVPPADDDIVTP
ncbi:MAG: hypothetical protein KJ749_00630 [Planctomycetes bacterium]|nr:hypothetical protein [Planctomycetota bacterium]